MEIGSFSNSFESSSVWLHRARGSSSYFSMCQALLKIGLLGESMLPFLIYGQEFYLNEYGSLVWIRKPPQAINVLWLPEGSNKFISYKPDNCIGPLLDTPY